MAVINGARALRIDREVGRVAAGYQADILILRGNPLNDLANASMERCPLMAVGCVMAITDKYVILCGSARILSSG